MDEAELKRVKQAHFEWFDSDDQYPFTTEKAFIAGVEYARTGKYGRKCDNFTVGQLVRVDNRKGVITQVAPHTAMVKFEDTQQTQWHSQCNIQPRSIRKSYAGEGKNWMLEE